MYIETTNFETSIYNVKKCQKGTFWINGHNRT